MTWARHKSEGLCHITGIRCYSFHYPKESPYDIRVQLAQWVQRRCLKILSQGRQIHWYTISSPRGIGPGEVIINKMSKVQIYFTVEVLISIEIKAVNAVQEFDFLNIIFQFYQRNHYALLAPTPFM